MSAVADPVTPAIISEVLMASHGLIARRGLSRQLFVTRLPDRPFEEWPLCVDAAIRVAVGHGPYPGCLTPDCMRCARADAARLYLARRLCPGGVTTMNPHLPATVLDLWDTHVSEQQVLAELAAAAADAMEGR